MPEVRVIGVPGLPDIVPGADLVSLIHAAVTAAGIKVEADDVFVIGHKIVS